MLSTGQSNPAASDFFDAHRAEPIGADNWQELCTAFEGALSLDETLNFEQDGEVRYYGPTSSRLEFQGEDGMKITSIDDH